MAKEWNFILFQIDNKFQVWSPNASPPQASSMKQWVPVWASDRVDAASTAEHDNGAIYCQGVISLI